MSGGKRFPLNLLADTSGVDLGLTRDRTAACVAHRDSETDHVVVDVLRTWKGLTGAPVDLLEVEFEIAHLARLFSAPVIVDPYQAALLGQRLHHAGVDVTEYPFTGGGRRRLFALLLQLVKDRQLHCFPHEDLRRELLALEVSETASGWRADHRPGHFDDHTVATALASFKLVADPRPVYRIL